MGSQGPPLTTRPRPLETGRRGTQSRGSRAAVEAQGWAWGPGLPSGRPSAMKLTRKMVLSRAKASELHSVRKLNCW